MTDPTPQTPTRDEAWRYSINYGPDGEQNFANVYAADGQFVGNLRTHHAIAICNAFAVCEKLATAPAPASGRVDVEALTYRVANAKLGEGSAVRCEGPTDFEKDQARAWVKRVLRALASLSPAPASGGVDAVGVCGISADTESKRVLKLHFKHEVTDADRKTIIDAFNTLNRERRSALSPAATPVSEAGLIHAPGIPTCGPIAPMAEPDLEADFFRMTPSGVHAALAKPASSPAGGNVVRCLATGNPVGTDTWQVGRPCRCANCSPLSQSTSAGRVGE